MKDRKKASDIFNETDFAFSKKVSFEKAFPEIDDFTIEVSESKDAIWGEKGRTRKFTKDNQPSEYFDCSNPACYSGGVSLGEILRQMVSNKTTEETVTQKCKGYEGSPKGHRRYRSCMHSFTVEVTLKYKWKYSRTIINSFTVKFTGI